MNITKFGRKIKFTKCGIKVTNYDVKVTECVKIITRTTKLYLNIIQNAIH